MKIAQHRRVFTTPVHHSHGITPLRVQHSVARAGESAKPKHPKSWGEWCEVTVKATAAFGLIGALIWAPWPVALAVLTASTTAFSLLHHDRDALSRLDLPAKMSGLQHPRFGFKNAVAIALSFTTIVAPWVYLPWSGALPVMVVGMLVLGFFEQRSERQGEAAMYYFNVHRQALEVLLQERRELIAAKRGGLELLAEADAMMQAAPHFVNRFISHGPEYAGRVMAIYEAQHDALDRLSTRRSVGNARELIDEVRN